MFRKTFIYFCKHCVVSLSRSFFKQHFLELYLDLSKDRVPHIRMEFSRSLVAVKPFLDYDMHLSVKLMEIMQELREDTDRDVVEAIDQCEFVILQ